MSDDSTKSSQTAVNDPDIDTLIPSDVRDCLFKHFHHLNSKLTQLNTDLKQSYSKTHCLELAKTQLEKEVKSLRTQQLQKEAQEAHTLEHLKKALKSKDMELINAYHEINEMRRHAYHLKYAT